MNDNLIPNLFKTEYSKIITVLCNYFSIRDIEIAEDIAAETFLLASETWGLKGIPPNPKAWLYTVAKNKTIDYIRKNNVYDKIISNKQSKSLDNYYEIEWSDEKIKDSQLKMIFILCNPINAIESQIILVLKILGGFGIEEIATTFLTTKENINKKIFRAKKRIKEAKIDLEHIDSKLITERLNSVLISIYLLFNEGYYSKTKDFEIQKSLCLEAMRLCILLIENKSTNEPETNALLSLMCFHSSRFEARQNELNEIILYENQNKNLWNKELIDKGNYYLIESAKGNQITKFHLEASIAYWHCTKLESSNKWENILTLYNKLLQIEYSPVAALNRTFALFKVKGAKEAIVEAEKLKLSDYLYFSLLGYLYSFDNKEKAIFNYKLALNIAKKENDRQVIKKYLTVLNSTKNEN